MKTRSLLKPLAGLVAAGSAVLGAYALVVRPWHLCWGATEKEVNSIMPGDDLVPYPKLQSTRAINIQAPAAQVWPWLAQWGYKRGGFYSYDWLDVALGSRDFSSATTILPEHQRLRVGDQVLVAPQSGFTVSAVEDGRFVVFSARYNTKTGAALAPSDTLPCDYMNASWAWLLGETHSRTTRLIIRFRLDYPATLANELIYRGFIEPGSFIMEQRMMQGIKQRAESLAR